MLTTTRLSGGKLDNYIRFSLQRNAFPTGTNVRSMYEENKKASTFAMVRSF